MTEASGPARRAVVVGAGIVGAAASLELGRRGWKVSLVEVGPAPRPIATSSDLSRVIRMDYGRDRELAELARASIDGWLEWNRTVFDRPLFHRTGFLLLSRTPLETGGFEADSLGTLESMGQPVERLGPPALAARHPLWAAGPWQDGYLSRHAGWAEAGEAVRQLVRRAEAAGVSCVDGRVVEVFDADGEARGVRLADGRRLDGDAVVLACGAWTPRLLAEMRPHLKPRAMPVLFFRPDDPAAFRPPGFPVWAADIARSGWYGFPASADGLVKIGHHGVGWAGDPEHPGDVPVEWEARCRAFLREHLPSLAGAPLVGTRACFYGDTRDGDFWIARHPERPGLVVAAGGSGHGYKFGPVLGPLVANAVEGVDDPRLGRFRWRPDASHRREDARAPESD